MSWLPACAAVYSWRAATRPRRWLQLQRAWCVHPAVAASFHLPHDPRHVRTPLPARSYDEDEEARAERREQEARIRVRARWACLGARCSLGHAWGGGRGGRPSLIGRRCSACSQLPSSARLPGPRRRRTRRVGCGGWTLRPAAHTAWASARRAWRWSGSSRAAVRGPVAWLQQGEPLVDWWWQP